MKNLTVDGTKLALGAGVAVALVLALVTALGSSPAQAGAVHGDVDCDGDVDAVDALFILRTIAGFPAIGDCADPDLDINCNDATEAVDALAILRHVAGLPPLNAAPASAGDCPPIGSPPTPTGAATPSPAPSLTPTGSGGPTPTLTPTPTPTPTGSGAPTPTPTPTGSSGPTPTPTPTPTSSGSPTPTPTPTSIPATLCGDPASPSTLSTTSSLPAPQEDGYQLASTGIIAPIMELTDYAAVPYTDGALVLTQTGSVYCVSPNGAPQLVAGMGPLLIDNGQIEEGLLTILFHPSYPASPYVYIYYNAPREPGESGFAWWGRISRFGVDLDTDTLDLASEEIIIQVEDPAAQHNGAGPIGFGNDGNLYASFGDGGIGAWATPVPSGEYPSQDLTDLLGTIVRIDVLDPPPGQTYGVPGGNPFDDDDGPNADEIWAYGLRNPWRGDIDPVTGDLWVAEVGDGAYDEVIGIVPGGNYGWPIREGPVCWHDREPCDPPPDYIAANVDIATGSLTPECAVIGGVIYRGTAMPELSGWFIYSDFCTGDIWGIDTQDGGASPVKLADVSPDLAVSSIDTLPNGELAVVPYLTGGILTLEPKP